MEIRVAGENAVIVYFGHSVNQETLHNVQRFCQAVEQLLGRKLIDLIPSYSSVVVVYDSTLIDYATIRRKIQALRLPVKKTITTGTPVELPVYYSPESGPDLESVAALHQLTVDEVINIHSSREYLVYAIGFAPGFAYLGNVDKRIATPRLSTPRLKVPAGAVAIADNQTAVYPSQSPGGWNLIGLCPTPMFDAHTNSPMPVAVGDTVRFRPVSREEFLHLDGAPFLEGQL